MNKDTIKIKRSDFESLLKTIDDNMTTFFLARMPEAKKRSECHCSIADELVGFRVRDAVMQVTRSFCELASVEFPTPTILKGRGFKKSFFSTKKEINQ